MKFNQVNIGKLQVSSNQSVQRVSIVSVNYAACKYVHTGITCLISGCTYYISDLV